MPKVNYGLTQPYAPLPMDPTLRPYVSVRLQVGGRYLDTMGLIDSGADSSLFNEQYALGIGLDLSKGHVSTTRGVGGQITLVYFDIFLTVRSHRFPARVGFSQQWPPQFGLLGRSDFFQAFNVGFDQRNQQVLLHGLPSTD